MTAIVVDPLASTVTSAVEVQVENYVGHEPVGGNSTIVCPNR